MKRSQQVLQTGYVFRELLGAQTIPSQCPGGDWIGARRAAKAEIDSARIETFQGAELLGNHQRWMVRQHDTAGAHPDTPGFASDVPHQYRGGGTGNPFHIVVLCQPETLEAKCLRMLGVTHAVGQCRCYGVALAHGGQFEQGVIGCSGHGVPVPVKKQRCSAFHNDASGRFLQG